jgi:hypothetical protein
MYEALDSNPTTTKERIGNGEDTEQAHVGLEPAVESLSWESVVNLLNIYSSALQTVLRIKICDTRWCLGNSFEFSNARERQYSSEY